MPPFKRTIADLISLLNKFPADSTVYAYEGEDTGIRIDDALTDKQIGWISVVHNYHEESKKPR